MIKIRPSAERGRTRLDWLDSRHTFSFGRYVDREHTAFSVLRVINEDWVAPGAGFAPHQHRDMEILTLVLEGALEHEDSTGNREVLRPGEIQRMTAGSGITHSEYNHSDRETVHLLQIWILPEKEGLDPGYEQTTWRDREVEKGWTRLAAPEGRGGVVRLHQDAELLLARPETGQEVRWKLRPGRRAWVQVARGRVRIDGAELEAGDGAAVEQVSELRILGLGGTEGVEGTGGSEGAQVLLFDLP